MGAVEPEPLPEIPLWQQPWVAGLVKQAVARFRWTGSWHTVFISIDPAGRLDLPPKHRAEIERHVGTFTQAGYDLEIVPPHYVPLNLQLEICAPSSWPETTSRVSEGTVSYRLRVTFSVNWANTPRPAQ